MTTQLAAGLAEQAEFWGRAGQHIISKAKSVLAGLILPRRIGRFEVERYYRKAHRTRAWRRLSREARALLQAARRVVRAEVRSPALRSVLTEIFLSIELHTLRARAMLHALIKLLARGAEVISERLNPSTLLVIGLNSASWVLSAHACVARP